MKPIKKQKKVLLYLYKQDLLATLRLSYPIVIAQIGTVLMGVTDNVMVGVLGASSLAAAGIANSIFFIVTILGLGTLSVLAPLVSAAKGRADKQSCSLLFSNSLLIGFLMGLMTVVLIVLLGMNFHWFAQKPEVEALAPSYLYIIASSALPMLVFLSLKNFTDGLAMTKMAMYITYFGLLNNIFFNWIFIYGNLGFPALGLDGAGYATLLSRILMAIAMAFYIAKSIKVKEFLPSFSLKNYHSEYFNKILRLGLPAGFQYFFEIAAFVGAAIMIGWLGTNQLAAHQIAINLASLTYMISAGFAAAGAIRVGNAHGQANRKKVLRYGNSAFILTGAFMTLSCICFILFNDFLVSLYIDESQVVQIAVSLLIIAGFFQLSDGIQVVALGALRGLEDVNIPTAITLFAYWVVGLPVAYILGFYYQWDVQGIWIGLSAGLLVSAVLLTLRFYLLAKYRQYQYSKKEEKIMQQAEVV